MTEFFSDFLRRRLYILFASAALSSCAVVPGLQIGVSAPDVKITNHAVSEADGVSTIEVTDAQGSIQKIKVVTLSGSSLLKSHIDSQAKDGPNDLGDITPMSPVPEYTIGPGDVLQVIVWDHPELTSPTGDFRDPVSAGRLVSVEGNLYYPYAGELNVRGMTVPQVRKLLTERLAKVISQPQVDIRVVAYRSQRVQVTGEVNQPGLVVLDDTPKGVLEALNERGGLTVAATRRSVSLIRGGKSYAVGITASSGDASKFSFNPALLPGDIIFVPARDTQQVFVLGEVVTQSAIALDRYGISLTEVIAKVGGLDKASAEDSGLLIFRKAKSADDVPTIYALDMGRPEGLLLAGEFMMEPNDVVYVKATNFAKYNAVINQLLPTISAIFQIDALTNR